MLKRFISIALVFLCLFYAGCAKKEEEKPEEILIKTKAEADIYKYEVYDEKLSELLISETEKRAGKWQIYVKNLNKNQYAAVGEGEVIAASVIKLFNMACYYDMVEKGEIKHSDSNDEIVKKMICQSSNYDSNEIVSIIGKGSFDKGAKKVTEYAKSEGYKYVREEHKLDSFILYPGHNRVSMRDAGKLLERIYKKECVSEEADEKMLSFLLAQERRYKIPANLPEGTKVLNKTGESSNVESDVGIVFSPVCDYVIAISVMEFGELNMAAEIAEISKTIYDYFNTGEQ